MRIQDLPYVSDCFSDDSFMINRDGSFCNIDMNLVKSFINESEVLWSGVANVGSKLSIPEISKWKLICVKVSKSISEKESDFYYIYGFVNDSKINCFGSCCVNYGQGINVSSLLMEYTDDELIIKDNVMAEISSDMGVKMHDCRNVYSIIGLAV